MQDNVPPGTVNADEFRRVMGLFATGVCVVSLSNGDGSPRGITANSFVSVSLDPMLICWSIQNDSSQFTAFAEADMFAISILNKDQQALAERYASRGDTQLRANDFLQSANGLPVVAESIGQIECRRWSVYPAGDHTMIFGEVTGITIGEENRPLGFFDGRFCGISD